MGPNTPYPVLIGQRLAAVRVFEPWQARLAPTADVGPAPLFGAVALVFERQALLLTSPLRYLSGGQGSQYGMADGRMASLGFRVTQCDADQLDAFLPVAYCRQGVGRWPCRVATSLPMAGAVLASLCVGESGCATSPWGIELGFRSGKRYLLCFRPELDGSIEVGPPCIHHQINTITVLGPDQDFGWLHPAAPLDFILDDRYWKSAQVSDWPVALRRALQSCADPELFYRHTLRRALLARCRQRPTYRQRLLALRYPVQCGYMPNGLIEEIAAQLRKKPIPSGANWLNLNDCKQIPK
jgi:hypothetical protein